MRPARSSRSGASFPFLIAIALSLAANPGCRRHPTLVESDVTGVKITVRYSADLHLTSLAISGIAGDQPAFPAGTLPDPPRPLAPGEESAVILLPEALAG